MATQLIELEANYSGRVFAFDSTNGCSVLRDGASLGHPVERPMYSMTFDAERVTVTGASKDAREQQFPVLVEADTLTQLQTQLDALDRILDDISRQGGGILRYRSDGGSYVTRYKVAAAKRSPGDLADYEAFGRVIVTVSMVVDLFGFADPYDITDPFAVNSLGTAGLYNRGGADWTADAGALTNGTVSGGAVDAAANLSTSNRWIHTGTPHTHGDVAVQLKHTVGATLTNYVAGVIHTRIDASNYLIAYVDDTGAASRLRIDKVVAGVTTNLASTALTRLVASTAYWIVGRIQGNVLFAEHWLTEPTPMGTPTSTATITLTTAEAAVFGAGIEGRVGILWTPIETTATLDDFRTRSLTYKNVTFPYTIPLEGAWGGTKDAHAGVWYTASGGTAPIWMLYAWWPRVAVHNMVWNDGAEVIGNAATGAGSAYGWTTTAVTSVTVAATSIARVTTASSVKTGTGGFEVVCPATLNAGVNFPIHRRGGFRKGVTYYATFDVRAAAGTTALTVTLCNSNSDKGPQGSSALSSTWTQRTATWTPTADYDIGYICLHLGAATATTFQFDNVMVFEGATAPTFQPGGHGPGIIPAAAFNTAAASLSSLGAYWTAATDATYLTGTRVRGSGAMTTTANLELPILPHLFVPDDYTTDEVDLLVMARCEVASTQTSLACAISLAPERGTSYGARRYGSNKSGGKTLKLPSSGTVFRTYVLGTISVRVDKTRPRREWLRLSFTNSGAASGNFGVDHLVVVPARRVARSQTGAAAAVVPLFVASTAETTKLVRPDLSGAILEYATGALTPDDGLGWEPMRLSPDGAELLVYPTDVVVDLTDSSTATQAKTFAGTVQVAVEPRAHLLRQS